jgi:hypothetical protein
MKRLKCPEEIKVEIYGDASALPLPSFLSCSKGICFSVTPRARIEAERTASKMVMPAPFPRCRVNIEPNAD